MNPDIACGEGAKRDDVSVENILKLTVPAIAASERALAASFPEKVAPSILAKYFCLVKQPARKKLEMGDVWTGRYNSRPAVAS